MTMMGTPAESGAQWLAMGTVSWRGLLERFGGDRDILALVVQEFLTEYPEQLATVGRSVAGRDSRAVASSAHRLKGAVVIFGDEPASDAALQLEQAGAAGDLATADEAYPLLEVQVRRLGDTLRSLLEREMSS